MEPIFLVEIGIVAIIIILQFFVFAKNNLAIRDLEEIYPDSRDLRVKGTAVTTATGDAAVVPQTLELIDTSPKHSSTFKEIVHTTNAYLTKNQGAADFDILKEIAQDKDLSVENAIESNITLPLYIGLLCTFTGVIIGLINISIEGVSDSAIQSFIGGVLIGMIGSAMGLGLTVRANYVFKNGKKQRDKDQYDYFTFLRTHILPALRKDEENPVGTLRENLSAFNDGFARYQQHTNESLGESLRLFSELKEVFKQIRSIEQGLSGMGHFLQANDGLIEKQIAYLNSYTEKAEAVSKNLGNHFTQVDQKMESLVAENVKALEKSTQAAYVKMDQYLASLTSGDSKAFVDALNKDLSTIQGDVENLQQKSLQVNTQLLTQLSKDDETHQDLVEQIRSMNSRLDTMVSGQGNFMNSFEFKLFVYAGSAAAILGIISGSIFIINQIAA